MWDTHVVGAQLRQKGNSRALLFGDLPHADVRFKSKLPPEGSIKCLEWRDRRSESLKCCCVVADRDWGQEEAVTAIILLNVRFDPIGDRRVAGLFRRSRFCRR